MKDWVLHRKFSTREHGRLGAGILLGQLLNELNKDDPKHRFQYYSAHDGTILALFSAMGIKKESFEIPRYGAYIIFESHQVDEKGRMIKILYNNQTLMRECDPLCSYETFSSLMKDGIIDIPTFEASCQIHSRKKQEKLDQLFQDID